jgi:hypothetical protein
MSWCLSGWLMPDKVVHLRRHAATYLTQDEEGIESWMSCMSPRSKQTHVAFFKSAAFVASAKDDDETSTTAKKEEIFYFVKNFNF